ncbi:MAG: Nin1 binding protein [Cirrosporium novae-zelandiae]|nr:MAG: Nin1 binding protein [Cirrosporium novae-zelandiae]
MADGEKPIHTIILDAGPIIKNVPAISTLLAKAQTLVTVPAIISEIRDVVTRQRVETTLLPFLTLRSPTPASIKVIHDFARKTGDLSVLSRGDIQILALTYELECERNGGDWRLRRVPGQKRLNGSPLKKEEGLKDEQQEAGQERTEGNGVAAEDGAVSTKSESPPQISEGNSDNVTSSNMDAIVEQLKSPTLEEAILIEKPESVRATQESDEIEEGDSDSDGWITPSNIKRHQLKDSLSSGTQAAELKTMQVACITTDFAMQNILLQMNLNLISPSLNRVRHLKTYILRCHACFFWEKPKEMSKQFCPRCGKPTLTRVSCSTDQNGEFKMHLKKNMQWNHRGDKYSIPKPIAGSANGKVKSGGGKNGWGQELILAEDQKEYIKAISTERRRRERGLMDEDYLPGILTGERRNHGGKVKIGAGRNVNSKKR